MESISSIWVMVLRSILMFFLTLVSVRIMGKRSIAQLAPFDLVVIIIIGSAAALPLEDQEISIVNGIIPLVVLSALQFILARVNMRWRAVEKITQGMSTPLVMNGQIMRDNLNRESVSDADLHIVLRQAGVTRMEEIALAVLEPTGQVSVVKKKEHQPLTVGELDLMTLRGIDSIRKELKARRRNRSYDVLGPWAERVSPRPHRTTE